MKIYSFLILLLLLLVLIKNENIRTLNLDDLYFQVDTNYMSQVITNLNDSIEHYVYLDIIKNPPNSFHSKIFLRDEINKIDIKKPKPFYEFYRDIIRVLGKMKDFHTMIFPFKNDTYYYIACIPFSFEIKPHENNTYKLYIKKSSICPFNYTDKELNAFIDDSIKEKQNILSINGKDPFDYLQNFGKEFLSLKDDNGHFTFVTKYISLFPLYLIPLNKTELNLKIKLSNNKEKTFSYFIYFDDFLQIPNIPEKTEFEWNYNSNYFRCRVDEKNKLNVFFQNGFYFDDMEEKEMIDLIYKCGKLFHSNNYKIVGIESNNGGGLYILPIYLGQLLQPKICKNKFLVALRKNDFLKEIFTISQNDFKDLETCKPPKSFEEILEKNPDDYGNNTKHYRTKVFDWISVKEKKDLDKKRKKLIKTKNTKKPTEIIIFTDYDSISATSIFLKGFQQTGGAIIVGYFGNPKNRNIKHESSVSSSGGINPELSTPFQNLEKLGLYFYPTSIEMYSYDYQGKNPIPQEYASYPVDEHVDIYEEYSDSIYQKFIDEANKIFKKYETKCNKNNKLLLLEDNNCYNIEGDNHAHGGYICGENGEWDKTDKTKCQAFYCDLGYYYDTYQKKCVEDLCAKSDDDEDNNWVFIVTIIAESLSILIVIIFIILFKFKKKPIESFENIEDCDLMESRYT